jgi:hypothetical protein
MSGLVAKRKRKTKKVEMKKEAPQFTYEKNFQINCCAIYITPV